MMDFLSKGFAPGALFAWLCVASIALIPLIWLHDGRARKRPTIRFSSIERLRPLATTWATRTRFVLPLLRTLAVVALIVALARPQSPGIYRDTSEGIAIQMVLDVSGSMAEEDFTLDGRRVRRLDAVKRVFRDFALGQGSLGGRENDLVGMTTFAMFADSSCPLTLDHAGLVDLLEEADIPGWVDGRPIRGDIEADYTALGDAIVLATDELLRVGEQAIAGVPGAASARSRIMILLTDGADNPPEFPGVPPVPSPLDAAEVAARLGVKIYTIGAVGSTQRPDAGFGPFAHPHVEVDEDLLERVASMTQGRYFRATDTDSLRTICKEINELERRPTGERVFRDNVHAAQAAMLIALVLLLGELLLVNTRYRKIP